MTGQIPNEASMFNHQTCPTQEMLEPKSPEHHVMNCGCLTTCATFNRDEPNWRRLARAGSGALSFK
jgi:hypothetical protein